MKRFTNFFIYQFKQKNSQKKFVLQKLKQLKAKN